MRILILRSRMRPGDREAEKGPYTQVFGSTYAERVIGNLKGESGEKGFCAACGPDCNACRTPYGRRFGQNIVGIVDLPAVLPYLLEWPREHVPREIPPCDILLAINVHEQVLLEIVKRCIAGGTRGVVVPIEAGDWISGSARADARKVCGDAGVEIAFPKPFCAFDPPAGSLLAQFRSRFHIGKPKVELTVRDGRIAKAHVAVSAACGATYYIARWLAGRRVDDDLKYEVIAKRMHSYPCTASMAWDDELNETILHVAGEAHYEILTQLTGERPPSEPGMILSPVGRMVFKPPPAREGLQNVERAKEAILEQLAIAGSVAIEDLRQTRRITPAAAYTATLLLKQEGKVRSEGGRIVPSTPAANH